MQSNYLNGLALATLLSFTVAVPNLVLGEDLNPPVEKGGIGCTSPEDVGKFVDLLNDVPEGVPTEVILFAAQGMGIQCSQGRAFFSKEEVVGHFTWSDGSPMMLLKLTRAEGSEIYTWRMEQPVKPSSCSDCI